MSTAVIAPVNPFAAESKPTVLTVMRRDREKFTRLVSDPKNWNVDTRCTGWETRDLVGHMIMQPYGGPAPAGAYATFQIMDYGVHPYDIEYGLGDKLATIDEASAGLIWPFAFVFWPYTVDEKAAKGQNFTYGIQVDGPWGGKWRATVKDGKWSAEAESGNFEGCDALLHFSNAADAVLTFFQRFPGGSASGDENVINTIR